MVARAPGFEQLILPNDNINLETGHESWSNASKRQVWIETSTLVKRFNRAPFPKWSRSWTFSPSSFVRDVHLKHQSWPKRLVHLSEELYCLGHFRTEVLAMHMLCTSMQVSWLKMYSNSFCPLASFSWCQTFAAVQGTLHRSWKDTNGTCLKRNMLTRSEKCQFHESYTTYWIIKTMHRSHCWNTILLVSSQPRSSETIATSWWRLWNKVCRSAGRSRLDKSSHAHRARLIVSVPTYSMWSILIEIDVAAIGPHSHHFRLR